MSLIYLKGIEEGKIAYRESKMGHKFACISLNCPQNISVDGKIHITVDTFNIYDNSYSPESLKDIRLGDPDSTRTVSICTHNGNGLVYSKIKMTNKEILSLHMNDISKRTAINDKAKKTEV